MRAEQLVGKLRAAVRKGKALETQRGDLEAALSEKVPNSLSIELLGVIQPVVSSVCLICGVRALPGVS